MKDKTFSNNIPGEKEKQLEAAREIFDRQNKYVFKSDAMSWDLMTMSGTDKFTRQIEAESGEAKSIRETLNKIREQDQADHSKRPLEVYLVSSNFVNKIASHFSKIAEARENLAQVLADANEDLTELENAFHYLADLNSQNPE